MTKLFGARTKQQFGNSLNKNNIPARWWRTHSSGEGRYEEFYDIRGGGRWWTDTTAQTMGWELFSIKTQSTFEC